MSTLKSEAAKQYAKRKAAKPMAIKRATPTKAKPKNNYIAISNQPSAAPKAKPAGSTAAAAANVAASKDPLAPYLKTATGYADQQLRPQLAGFENQAQVINNNAIQQGLNTGVAAKNQQLDLQKLFGDLQGSQRANANTTQQNYSQLQGATDTGYNTLQQNIADNGAASQAAVASEQARLGITGANTSRAAEDTAFLGGLAQINRTQAVQGIASDATARGAADQANVGVTGQQGASYIADSQQQAANTLAQINQQRNADYNDVLNQYTQLSGTRGGLIHDTQAALEQQQYDRGQAADQQNFENTITGQKLNLTAQQQSSLDAYHQAQLQLQAQGQANTVDAGNADRALKADQITSTERTAAARLQATASAASAKTAATAAAKAKTAKNGGFRIGANGAKDFISTMLPTVLPGGVQGPTATSATAPPKIKFLQTLIDRIANNTTKKDPKNPKSMGFDQTKYGDMANIMAGAEQYVKVHAPQYDDADTKNLIAQALQVYFGKYA